MDGDAPHLGVMKHRDMVRDFCGTVFESNRLLVHI